MNFLVKTKAYKALSNRPPCISLTYLVYEKSYLQYNYIAVVLYSNVNTWTTKSESKCLKENNITVWRRIILNLDEFFDKILEHHLSLVMVEGRNLSSVCQSWVGL